VHLTIGGFEETPVEESDEEEKVEERQQEEKEEDDGRRWLREINTIACSDDGSVVAVGCDASAQGMIRVWRTRTAVVPVGGGSNGSVCSLFGARTKVYEKQWEQPRRQQDRSDASALLSPRELPSIMHGCGRCPRTGTPLGVDALALASNNLQLVAGGAGGNICMWKLGYEEANAGVAATMEPMAVLRGQFVDVSCITFSPDCSVVVAGGCSGDGRVRVWDGHSQQHVQTITAYPAAKGVGGASTKPSGVACIAVSVDSQWIVTGGNGGRGIGDCSMKVWRRTIEMKAAWEKLDAALNVAANHAGATDAAGVASAAMAVNAAAAAQEALPSLVPNMAVGGAGIEGWVQEHDFEHELAVATVLFSQCGRFACSASGKQV
jgi:WD40 repeat protein